MDYDSRVRQRFIAARRAGPLDADTPGLVCGEAEDRTLNVWIRFQLRISDRVIQTARYNVYGCPHTVAAAEWASGWLEGRPAEALRELRMREHREALGVPVEMLGKLLLVEDALGSCWRRLGGLKG